MPLAEHVPAAGLAALDAEPLAAPLLALAELERAVVVEMPRAKAVPRGYLVAAGRAAPGRAHRGEGEPKRTHLPAHHAGVDARLELVDGAPGLLARHADARSLAPVADLVGAWTLTATVSGTRYPVVMERDLLCKQIALRTSAGHACADYFEGTLMPLNDLCLAAPCAPTIPAGTHFTSDAGFFRGTIVQSGVRIPATLKRTDAH